MDDKNVRLDSRLLEVIKNGWVPFTEYDDNEGTWYFDLFAGCLELTKYQSEDAKKLYSVLYDEFYYAKDIYLGLCEDYDLELLADDNQILKIEVQRSGLYMNSLHLRNAVKLPAEFLFNDEHLKHFSAPKLRRMGDKSFFNNKKLSDIKLLELQYMGDFCFGTNKKIKSAIFLELKSMGKFCFGNTKIKTFISPVQESIENTNFLESANRIYMPNLKIAEGSVKKDFVAKFYDYTKRKMK